MSHVALQQQLLKIALLGSERQTQAPQAQGALQPMIQALYPENKMPDGDARASALLSAMAILDQYQCVGKQPDVFEGQLVIADHTQPLPEISAASELHLNRLLNDHALRPLLLPWLETAAEQGLQVSPRLMPALLHMACQKKALRALISSIIGSRGQWLAQQNPAWHHLSLHLVAKEGELDHQCWEEGSLEQRVDYLKAYRQQDTQGALVLLQAVWSQEAANVRQALLATLKIGLSLADEAWLESCLNDRSKLVQRDAAILLGSLEASALRMRHQQRLTEWLRLDMKSGLLGKLGAKPVLQVKLPETWDKTWLRDRVLEKPPQGMGAKAWWLEQSLALVPPSFWCEHWGIAAQDLLALTHKHDWQAALLSGFRQGLCHYPDPEWIEAWALTIEPLVDELWAVLTPEQAELLALKLLEPKLAGDSFKVLRQLEHAWSAAFSQQVLTKLGQWVARSKKQSIAYPFMDTLNVLAVHMHPDSLCEMEALLTPYLPAHNQSNLHEVMFHLRFRIDMLSALVKH